MSIGLVVELKAIALVVGLVTQGTLKAAEYLFRGVETVAGQGRPIDLEGYARTKTE